MRKYLQYIWIPIAILIGLSTLLFNSSKDPESHIAVAIDLDTIEIKIPVMTHLYGLSLDSFEVVHGKIRRNEFLADILLKYNVPYVIIDRIAKKSTGIYDVKKLASGKNYTLFCSTEPMLTCKYFVYKRNAADYVVYKLYDDIDIYLGQKEITVENKFATGVITNSLYQCMVDNDINPVLALELSDIYAWQVDFFRIQKGDQFKILYEEKFVEGESLGIGHISGIVFNHFDQDYYAIYFEQNGDGDYFDEKGFSLRKAFLKAPLKYSRITSRYSKRRYHPVLKRWKSHLGTDYAAPAGTPIRAVGDGYVTEAKYKKYNGNYVKIKHNSTYSTQYLHMSKIASGISPGVKLKQGQIIGYVGSTGLATGPHVCFRFWKNGEQVNPFSIKIPPSIPVKPENKAEFEAKRNTEIQKLKGINPESSSGRLTLNQY